MGNLDTVLKSAQVVFVAFCADWCPFSRRLKPIFEEAATKWHQDNPQTSGKNLKHGLISSCFQLFGQWLIVCRKPTWPISTLSTSIQQ